MSKTNSHCTFLKVILLLLIYFTGYVHCYMSTAKSDYLTPPPTKFLYFHKSSISKGLSLEDIVGKGLEPKNVLVYAHDYLTSNFAKSGATRMKDAILQNKNKGIDVVIIVDWREASWQPDRYPHVASFVLPVVAEHITEELQMLQKSFNLKFENVELAGHGLGAHLMGRVAKGINALNLEKIKQITGYNPSGSLFNSITTTRSFPTVPLSKEEATYVRVIHTDYLYGLSEDIGTEDVYVVSHEVLRNCENKMMMNPMCKHDAAVTIGIQEITDEIKIINDKKSFQEGESSWSSDPSLIFVLDVSSSIHVHQQLGWAMEACRGITSQLPIGTSMSVIQFGGTATVIQNHTVIKDNETRKMLMQNFPDDPQAILGSDIGSGFQAAYDTIIKSSNACFKIILITDGDNGNLPKTSVKPMHPLCARIYGFIIGNVVNETLEQFIYEGGGTITITEDMSNVRSFLLDSVYEGIPAMKKPTRLPTRLISLEEGKPASTMLEFDQGTGKTAEIAVVMPPANIIQPMALSSSLISPSQQNFSKPTIGRYNIIFTQPNAEIGLWTLNLVLPESKLNTNLSVVISSFPNSTNAPTTLDSHVFIKYDEMPLHHTVAIFGKLSKGQDRVLDCSVHAMIVDVKGTKKVDLELRDDGLGADEEASDGIYSRYYVAPLMSQGKPSHFKVQIIATCNSSAKVRPSTSLSFNPISRSDLEYRHLQPLGYSFERETGAGSIRSQGMTKPSKVRDLRVSALYMSYKQIVLEWSAPGGRGDTGNVSDQQILISSEFSETFPVFDKSTSNLTVSDKSPYVVEGSLVPLDSGMKQEVTIEVPEDLWTRFLESGRLYVVLYSSTGQLSDVVLVLIPNNEEVPGWTILIVVICTLLVVGIGTGILYRNRKVTYEFATGIKSRFC